MAAVVGLVTAAAVFAVMYAAFANREDVVVVGPTGTNPPGSATPPKTEAPVAKVSDPLVVKSRIDDQGEIETVQMKLNQGDELRIKVVPTDDDFDPVVGLAMNQSDIVPDFFEEGFHGNFTQLFKDEYRMLYNDTEPPGSIAPILATNDNAEGFGEYLLFIAPVSAEYSIVARGAADSTGSYVLTAQSRSSVKPVRGVDRLDADDHWFDRDAAATRAKEAADFLTDKSFYSDKQFEDGSDYLGPSATATDGVL